MSSADALERLASRRAMAANAGPRPDRHNLPNREGRSRSGGGIEDENMAASQRPATPTNRRPQGARPSQPTRGAGPGEEYPNDPWHQASKQRTGYGQKRSIPEADQGLGGVLATESLVDQITGKMFPKLNEINQNVAALQGRFEAVESRVEGLEGTVEENYYELAAHTANIDDLHDKHAKLLDEHYTLKKAIEELKQQGGVNRAAPEASVYDKAFAREVNPACLKLKTAGGKLWARAEAQKVLAAVLDKAGFPHDACM